MERLSERKHNILKAVVEEYIREAKEVSSGDLHGKYFSAINATST